MTERTADYCGVLILDVAGSVTLRRELGDAVAGPRILSLLDAIIAVARKRGASFIKAYGDDVLAVFETDPIAAAAETAIQAQILARDAGLKLYAGFHQGTVQFRQTDGHLDAVGQTINFVARLHKLTEDAPGQIFIVEETARALPVSLRGRTFPFGQRTLKGVGKFEIWTLNWGEAVDTDATVFLGHPLPLASQVSVLTLRHRNTGVTLNRSEGKYLIGRGAGCSLIIADPGLRISTNHLTLECIDGYWFLQDVSRNGTWLKTRAVTQAYQLPSCQKVMLPKAGAATLGRHPQEDPNGLFTVVFQLVPLRSEPPE